MPEKDKKSPLPEPPKNPLEFIQDLDSAVRNADGVLSGVDERLRGFDDQLTSKSERTEAPETPQHSHKSESKGVDYCLDCCSKHLSKASVFLNEASQKNQKEKVKKTIMELTGCEDDSLTNQNEKIRKLNADVRAVRKEIWNSPLSLGRGSDEDLNRAREKVENLLDRVYKLREEEAEVLEEYA